MKRWGAWMIVLAVLAGIIGTPAALAANVPGGKEITIQYKGETILGNLQNVWMDEQRNMMGVSFYCDDLKDHIKMETDGDDLIIIVPVLARISAGGETLRPMDATFYQTEVLWFFDTESKPDTVTFYPYGDDDPTQEVTVDASSGIILKAESAPAPDTGSEPSPEPIAPAGDNAPVAAILAELGNGAKDSWEKAIYGAGAAMISQDGDTYICSLRSFNPRLKSLPNYSHHKQAWLEAFFANVQAFDLEVSLELNNGAPVPASLKALKTAVTKAAKAAKDAFGQKSVREAIVDLLLPKPVDSDAEANGYGELRGEYHALVSSNPAFTGMDSVQLTPLFYAQRKQSLDVKEGPHALRLNCTGADPAALLEGGRKALMDRFSKVYKANEMERYEIREAFADELAKQAAAIRKKGGQAHAFALNIDELSQGDFGAEYGAYMQSFDPEPVLDRLVDDIQQLPDAPAQPFPKNGRISGSKSGTKVILKTPSDGLARYVQVRGASDDKMAVDMFIRPGGSATVNVPQGKYYLLIASGETWHGMEGLFGSAGNYSESEEVGVPSRNYYLTLTLGVSNGDTGLYRSDPGAFQR